MKSTREIYIILNSAIGTENFHRFSPFPGYPVITDGVFLLAEAADCYWLLDLIGSYQNNRKLDPTFQVWKLTVDLERKTAVVQGCNDTVPVVAQKIPHTDFPLEELKLYVIDGVILLPSEYPMARLLDVGMSST